MKTRLSKRLAVGLAVAVAASMLAACGGGDKGGGSDGEKVLIIGVGSPLTQGDVAFGQSIKKGTDLAVKMANESDQAKKLKIKFKTVDGDDQSDPKTGTTVANSFASTRDLVGVVGHFNSTVSIAASKVYHEKNIVMISPGSTNPTLTEQGYPSIFRTTATDAVQGPVGAEKAIELGYKTVAVVNDSSTYGEGLAKEFASKFTELGGTVVMDEKSQQKQNDFAALATKIASLKPDLVYFGGTYAADTGAGALFSKQVKAAGVTVPVMGGDGLYAEAYIELAGNPEGDLATCPGLPPDLLPKAEEFAKAYAEAYPDEEVGPFDAYAYDAAWSLIYAVFELEEKSPGTDFTSPTAREDMVKAVAASDFEGVTGQVSYDSKGDNQNQAVTLYKVSEGLWLPQP